MIPDQNAPRGPLLTRRQSLGFFALAALGAARFAHAAEPTWESLFDGRTLTGWRPTAKSPHSKASNFTSGGRWEVRAGAITGGQEPRLNGGLLLTERDFGDFEVSVETNNDFGPDSGLFLRCTEDGKAYQCLIDYHKGGTIGGILGEGIWKRRGERNFTFGEQPELITVNPHAQACPFTPEGWKKLWRVGGWNEVRARIVGDPPVITTWVNGVQILSYREPVAQHPARGRIGLQVHGGAGFDGLVRYRNLRVRVL